MNNVIEFKSSKESLMERKLKEFNEFKAKEFSGILTLEEEKEYDKTYQWIKIHNC